jgi:hypothetical protein
MRTVILIAFFYSFLLMVSPVSAQDKHIFKYRTDTAFKCRISPDGTQQPWEGFSKATKGYLIVLDLTHLKISTYLKKTTNYSIINLEDHFTKDDNGQFVRIKCVDDNNVPCRVIYRMVDNNQYGLDASVTILYPEYGLLYVLTKQ